MSSTAIIKIPVSLRGSSPGTPSKKRRVTPSAEQSSPRRALIQLFCHAHPSPQDHKDERETWHKRHILLPYNLRDFNISIYRDDVQELLNNIFPETTNVTESICHSHLIFQLGQLPKSPWPLTIGGRPFTICNHSNGRAFIFPRQRLGNLRISICQQDYKFDEFSDQKLRDLGASVNSWFEQNLPETRIIELMLTSEHLIYIVLEDHADISSQMIALPGRIAACPVGYLRNRELHRPLWTDFAAKRQIEPQPISGEIDDTVYDTLRPGVLISTSHGVGDDGNMWQGIHPGRSIGEAVLELSFTDISLVNLENDITFVNETFENISGDSPKFSRLATSEDKFVFDLCFLNSPYTGNMEATMLGKSVRMEKSIHPTEDGLRYIIYNWCYAGQMEGNEDHVCPPDGTCGSAIWNDDGVITGFYHYYIEEGAFGGFSASVSASELVKAGYTLVKE
ncbi:hypothetical protein F4678DRAFT_478490 [Xylaria arbuscula]|nr:hypothetical protein F4678DRAFT_478490 [Xylaria arbuscula]